jgi:cytochrome bd-type quinol oxidase subunit 2
LTAGGAERGLGQQPMAFPNPEDALLPALAASALLFLVLLYVRGIVRAYRAAGESWKAMDRDVRLVFLLAVPLFRGGIKVLLWMDSLFYTPSSER